MKTYSKLLFFSIICLLSAASFSSCKDKTEEGEMYCNSLNPANDIFWLRELINTQKKESLYKMAIYRCDYKGSQGFLVVTYVNPPFCQYYNCRGDLICQLGGSSNLKTCEDFPENATLGNLVFRDTTAAKPF